MGEPAKKIEDKKGIVAASLVKVDENELFDLKTDKIDFGRSDSLRYNILTWVLEEKYDKAITEMRDYLERPSEYPDFHRRIVRFVNHAIDLIYAIKAKRNFPGIGALTRAKQQELREKFREHFKELQQVLKTTEKIETDLRIHDARSTIYVIRAVWLSLIAILGFSFFLEFSGGLGQSTFLVINDIMSRFADVLLGFIGF